MATTVQEAIYRFEMKGETQKAISLLEKVISQGDKDDKEQAYFYLGKIYELSNNKSSANFYYKQSINSTKETQKAYWLSERDAATNSDKELLLKETLKLSSPIKKQFSQEPTYFVLQNGSIVTIKENKIIPIKRNNLQQTEIFEINKQGIWYANTDKDSLFFRPHNEKKPSQVFSIPNVTQVYATNEKTLVQNDKAFFLITKNKIANEVREKYNDCQIESFYAATNHFIINCPDNALHFISAEDISEAFVISQFDAIQKVLIDNNDIIFYSGGNLYCYRPKESSQYIWKISINNVEEIIPFENKIAILDASGVLWLIEKRMGSMISFFKSYADKVKELAKGSLGLFTNEGALIVVDTLLRPLWHFNFAKKIIGSPIKNESHTYLYFGDSKLQEISSNYYGKRHLLSESFVLKANELVINENWEKLLPVLDTLLKLEPGNAEAWLFKALYLENNKGKETDKQKAWSEAVRLSISNPQVTSTILSHYSKAIGAKFVNLLSISPKTKYPQLFGSKKNIFTVDPAANKILCFNADNGELRWSKKLAKTDVNPIISYDDKTLVMGSSYSMYIYELSKDTNTIPVQIPGKAFNITIDDNAIYVSTWNGFLLKILKDSGRLAWSRKVFSIPFLFVKKDNQIITISLEGEIQYLLEGPGQIYKSGPRLQGGISQIALADSVLAISTNNNRLYLYNIYTPEKEPTQILMESAIASIKTFENKGVTNILISLANQSLLLYTAAGTPLWKFQGKNSIFLNPFIHNGLVWLDQSNEVIAISLKDGSIEKKFSIPGGAGTPFILNQTLYSASDKRLLYGFSF